MNLIRRLWAACIMLALGGATMAQTTQPSRPSLLAYGSSDHYWIANIESYKEANKIQYKTLLRGQILPAGDWKDLGVVYGYAAGLAEAQNELAILLDDGSWKRRTDTGLTTGQVVPGSGPVLAWGSAGSTLYAIRAVNGGKNSIVPQIFDSSPPIRDASTLSTTRAATTPANVTSQPTTRPTTLVLLRFDKGQWQGAADLPVGAGPASVTIAGVGTKLLLAAASDTGEVRVWALVESKWEGWGEIQAASRPKELGALALGNVPALWMMDQDGGVKVFLKREGDQWTPLKAFTLPKAIAPTAQRTLAAAGEEIRLVVLSKEGKVWERRYDATGNPRGDLAELQTPQVYRENPMVRVFQLVVLLAMVIVMLVTFYKRRSAAGKQDEP